MSCSRCNSNNIRKDGFANKRQRYHCKTCSYRFTVRQRKQKPINYKRLAVTLHLEGLSNRSIKSILGVSDVAIMKWIRTYSNQPEKIQAKKIKINYLSINDINSLLVNNSKIFFMNISDGQNEIYMLK